MKGHARNLMTDRVLAVAPATTLVEIARALVSAHHGGVPVIDDQERVIGFVSESDLLDAVLRGDPATTTADAIMSHPVLVVDEFTPTDEVMSLLKDGKVRHLPVVRSEKLVGIITPHDVLEFCVEHVLPIPPEEA